MKNLHHEINLDNGVIKCYTANSKEFESLSRGVIAYYGLKSLYASFSKEKETAYNYCRDLALQLKALKGFESDDVAVLRGNSQMFTFARKFLAPHPIDGDIRQAVLVITKKNNRLVFLED